jgi:drug/metabolite transporter (DMT)-like permease
MIRSVLSAHILLFIATCFSSINFTIAKVVMPSELSPNSIVLTRIVVATVCFFLFDLFTDQEKYIVPIHDKVRLVLCGLFGVGLNQLFLYKGLSITSPINSSLIMAVIPVLVLILSALLLKNTPTWKQYLGVALSAIGAYYLIAHTHNLDSISSFEGDMYIFLNASCYAIFMVLAKPLLEKYHPLFVTKWMFAIAIVVVFPFTIKDALASNWSMLSTEGMASYIYIILFATVFNYYVSNASLQWISAVTAGSYIYLQPFLASMFAVSIGRDVLSMEKVGAGVLILLGVLLTSRMFNKVTP